MFEERIPLSSDAPDVKLILRRICGDHRAAHPDAMHAAKKYREENESKDDDFLADVPNKGRTPCAHIQRKIWLDYIEILETLCYLGQSSL